MNKFSKILESNMNDTIEDLLMEISDNDNTITITDGYVGETNMFIHQLSRYEDNYGVSHCKEIKIEFANATGQFDNKSFTEYISVLSKAKHALSRYNCIYKPNNFSLIILVIGNKLKVLNADSKSELTKCISNLFDKIKEDIIGIEKYQKHVPITIGWSWPSSLGRKVELVNRQIVISPQNKGIEEDLNKLEKIFLELKEPKDKELKELISKINEFGYKPEVTLNKYSIKIIFVPNEAY